MNTLLLSLHYPPDSAANAVVVGDLTDCLSRIGARVRTICALPHYGESGIWSTWRGRLSARECEGECDVTRVWLYVPPRKTSLPGRLLNYLSFNILSTLAGLFSSRPDIILAPSPPLTIGLTAWLLGLWHRAPYIYNVQDIYPDVAIRLGVLRNRHAIRFFSWMERFVYRHAAAVTVISEGFRRNLLAKGVPPEKVVVIPNFVDAEFVSPRPKDNPFSRREGLTDRFVVLFAGNVGLSQGLEHVLETARLLAEERDILFLIVGNGASKPTLEEQAARMGLSNVRFLPFQPREDVPDLYAAADLCLVPLKKGIAEESVPSKALTICAAGRPMVASVDPDSDIERFVHDSGAGLCVPPEEPQAMAEAIRTLYRSPERRQQMGRRGRAHVLAHYTPEAAAQAYHDLFEGILARRRGAPEEEGQPYMGA